MKLNYEITKLVIIKGKLPFMTRVSVSKRFLQAGPGVALLLSQTAEARLDFKTSLEYVARLHLKTLKIKTSSNNKKSPLPLALFFPPLSKDISKFLKNNL